MSFQCGAALLLWLEASEMQSADEYATTVCDAFRRTLLRGMNQAITEKLNEHIEADLTREDVERIGLAMVDKPDWFPRLERGE